MKFFKNSKLSKKKNPYAKLLSQYSDHAWDQSELEDGKNWSDYFRSRMSLAPVRKVLEIGCSNADFLCRVAERNRDTSFIGVDWKFKILCKGAKRVADLKLENVALIRGLAQNAKSFFPSSPVLDEIWIFFPDPWAKKSQFKNRIMNEGILTDLRSILKKGGQIYFKTDHPGYYQWVLALFGKKPKHMQYNEQVQCGENAWPDGVPMRGRRAKQIKLRKPAGAISGDLPERSEKLCETYQLVDNPNLVFAKSIFAGEKTLFEKVFDREGLPSYAVVLKAI